MEVKFFIHWTFYNCIGLAIGAVLGEFFGHSIESRLGWQIGLISAGIIFESIVWTVRALVLRNTAGFIYWQPIDTVIWIIAEGFGFLFSEGLYEVTDSVLMVAGPMAGSFLGTFLLALLWLILITNPRKHSWRIWSFLYGMIGIFGGSFLISIVLVSGQELAILIRNQLGVLWGLGVFSILAGGLIGLVSGIAYINLKIVRHFDPELLK